MNPMAQSIVATLVRYLFGGCFAVLAAKGAITPEQGEYLLAGIAGFVVTVGMALWARYRDRSKIVTALTQPTGTTEAQVEKIIARGASPSTMTLKTEVPSPTPPIR